jgi:diguanylate cyclase (GGDEF)-like protein
MIIYAIIFSLFAEVKNKIEIEQDKQKLSSKVTLLAAQSEKMKAIAFNDALTGVRNRYSLYTDMNQFIFAKQSFLIVFIDLNNLKEINDKYNHQKGDVYLTQFALAIQKGLKQRGEVYRYGGDEFVCLIKQDELVFDYEVLSKEIEKEMDIDTPFYGFCYGVAAYPKDGSDTEELIDFADQEMYVQKKDH